jgi:hypothetical protein
MKADEAADFMDRERETDRLKQRAAIAIAFLAMLLAITGLGGQNATKDALNSNIEASNLFTFFQAKNMRQTSLALAADALELGFSNDPAIPDTAKAALRAKAEEYKKTIARYESEPETQEGKKELLIRAKAQQDKRDRALKQDPFFDYAETLIQIAIVLISVSIVAEARWLSCVGGALGLGGALLMINAFLLLVEVPFLS